MKSIFATCTFTLAFVACGGNVTLGKTSGDLGKADGASALDGGSAPCVDSECGPRPGAPALLCADGTSHDWECKRDGSATCGWKQDACGTSDGGAIAIDAGEAPVCADTTCGPKPGAPTLDCGGGVYADWTCLGTPSEFDPSGFKCGWSQKCPGTCGSYGKSCNAFATPVWCEKSVSTTDCGSAGYCCLD